MKRRPLRTLIVEDSEDDALLLVRELRRGGFEPVATIVENSQAMESALRDGEWDLIISDYVLPEFSGLEALELFKKTGLDLPFIIVSGSIGEDIAVAAMKAGAHDYLMKGHLKRLVPAVERELGDAEVRRSRRKAREALVSANELLETIFAVTRVMVAYLDVDLNFLRVNAAYAKAAQQIPEFFEGKSYFAAHPDPENEAIFRRVLQTGEPYFGHARPLSFAGVPEREPVLYDWSLQPVTGVDGRVDGLVLSLTDITKELRLEEHLRQSQKMEALGTLAGGIAHDFNNILTAIAVNAEMAFYEAGKQDSVREYLPHVLEAANRGKELVKKVLAFSRKSDQERRPTRLSAVLKEALGLLRTSLPKTIEIRERISTKFDVALVDATQVHQVLMNLGSNAAYAMRENGGTLEVTASPVEVDARMAAREPDLRPGPYIRVTVKDTGVGIPPDVRPRIFDPFFTTKPPEEGTGMGLSMVHGIVKSCGGAVLVESRVGKGTTFSVFFPRLLEDVEQGQEALRPIAGGNERILVIDDEEIQAQTLQTMLERLGYRVVAESNSRKAIEIFKGDPQAFDLIVTDQEMPLLPGTKLAEAILKLRPEIPMILCTGYSEVVDEDSAKSLGIRIFLMKPYSVREMAEAVRKALGEKE